MLVKVEMDIGEFARGISEPYLKSGTNRIDIDYVQGIIEKVDKSNKHIKVENYGGNIPFHRVYEFTFGGILLDNKLYDDIRIMNENDKAIQTIKNNLGSKRI